MIKYCLLLSSFIIISCSADPRPGASEAANNEAESADTTSPTKSDSTGHFKRNLNKEDDYRFLTGRFEPSEHPDFTEIDEKYADRSGMYMHRQAYDAFREMHEAAARAGIELTIISAARNFEYQKGIWERKWNGETQVGDGVNLAESDLGPEQKAAVILQYSSMPGTSRHHWGTDIDLNALNNAYFESGEGEKVFNWLQANASEYGYCRPYNKKGPNRPFGYEEEKWHWSYKPLAKYFLSDANTLIWNEDMEGYSGSELANKMLIKEKYILGVNDNCK